MLLRTLTSVYGSAEGTKINYMIEQAIFTSAFGCPIYRVAKLTETPLTEIKSRFTGHFIMAAGDVLRRIDAMLQEALSMADPDQINMDALIDNAALFIRTRLNATLTAYGLDHLPILNDANHRPIWDYDKDESNV